MDENNCIFFLNENGFTVMDATKCTWDQLETLCYAELEMNNQEGKNWILGSVAEKIPHVGYLIPFYMVEDIRNQMKESLSNEVNHSKE